MTEFGLSLRSDFYVQDCTFLNNGSFGGTPKQVLAVAREYQEQLERQPIYFVQRVLPKALRDTANTMAEFLGTRGENIAFVQNASTGVNSVLYSLLATLQPGDELLTTSHVYNAVRQQMKHIAMLKGARYVEVEVPFPIHSDSEIVDRVRDAITDRTVFALFDHVTSPTGIVFPIVELVQLCKSKGISVMIDGAHTPGLVDVHLDSLGADWFTGNFHKWLYAPKGCAFLYTSPEKQAITHPTVISHGYTMGYTQEFDFTGTMDWSSYLSAPAGLEYYRQLESKGARSYCRDLTIKARDLLCTALRQTPPAPNSMLANLASVVLPVVPGENAFESGMKIHDTLWDSYNIEVPIFPFGTTLLIRVACHVFNEVSEYEKLASVLPTIV